MADNTNTPGVAAPKEGNNKCFNVLFRCSYSAIFQEINYFRFLTSWLNELWFDFSRLVSTCMDMWFTHHLNREHVLYNRSKHGTEYIGQGPLHARVWKSMQQRFCETFIYNKFVLTGKNNNLVNCTHTKSFRDLVKKFEKAHKPLNGYFEK